MTLTSSCCLMRCKCLTLTLTSSCCRVVSAWPWPWPPAADDRDADEHHRLHLHRHRVQLLPQVLRQGRGRWNRLQVSRHVDGERHQGAPQCRAGPTVRSLDHRVARTPSSRASRGLVEDRQALSLTKLKDLGEWPTGWNHHWGRFHEARAPY